MKLLLRNTAGGLIPLYDDDFDAKKRLKIGEDYMAEIKKPRNIRQHRLYFSLINCAWDLLDQKVRDYFGTPESFRKTLQVAAGHCERVFHLRLREWVEVPKSIAFDKMSGDEFEELYKGVRKVLFTVFLKHVTMEQFDEYLVNY